MRAKFFSFPINFQFLDTKEIRENLNAIFISKYANKIFMFIADAISDLKHAS